MSFIRTVLGDIDPDRLGVCYAHEHIIIDRSFTTQLFPDFLLDDVDRAAEELQQLHADGGRAVVDSMPCASGRNVLKLAEVSRRSGVHVLCPTGFHLKRYYPEGSWGVRLSADELAALFADDINLGVDKNDYAGPTCERTEHKAGVIKIASGLDRLDDHELRLFEAAGIAHRTTGAPILTHTERGTAALEQVQVLGRHGVAPRHVVLSHTDRQPDPAYHQDILATGVNVEYDSHFRWKEGQGNPTRDLVVAMCEAGYADQLMLGMDAARRSYWVAHGGGPGMSYLLTTFSAMLRDAGLTDEHLRAFFVDNPRRAYAFGPVGS
ncbi:MAG: aryldialkylphosphatase [Planctomycetota bacterium]